MNNSGIEKKIELREHFLEKKDSVLDMCCGEGVMYRECYRGKCNKYTGIDLKGGSFTANIIQGNSIEIVNNGGLFEADFIDIDPWGSFNSFYNAVISVADKKQIKIICTDGGFYSAEKRGIKKYLYKYKLKEYCEKMAKNYGYKIENYICLNEKKMFYFGFILRRL
jgi:SAM-dependent methyltransferase